MFSSTTNNLKLFSVHIEFCTIYHSFTSFFLLLYTLPCITVEEHNLKNLLSATKNLLFNEKCPWMVYNER